MSLLNLYHLAIYVVIFVACAVMLRLIWRESKVVKLNIHVEDNLGVSGLENFINIGPNKLLFSLIWRGRSECINANWDSTFSNACAGRIQPPITAEFLGRKVTIIVDGRDNEMERSITPAEYLARIEPNKTADDRRGFAKIKIVLLVGDCPELKAAALRDIYSEQHNQCADHATN